MVMSAVPQWLEYLVLGVVVLVVVVRRQLTERALTAQRLVALPLIFVVLAFATDRSLGHQFTSPAALAMMAVGLVVAAVTGAARAMTMRIRRVGGTVLTKGDGRTLALWLVTIAVRVGQGAAAYALGIPEGTGEALLFAAATFAAQGVVLAARAGLFAPVGVDQRIGERAG